MLIVNFETSAAYQTLIALYIGNFWFDLKREGSVDFKKRGAPRGIRTMKGPNLMLFSYFS